MLPLFRDDKIMEYSRGYILNGHQYEGLTKSEFTISREKYKMVRDAMDKSKASIFVKCDE